MIVDRYVVILERHEELCPQIDTALDKLITVWIVLASDDQSWVEDEYLKALAAVLRRQSTS